MTLAAVTVTLGETLVIEVTCVDRRNQRQSLAGVPDLRVDILKPDFTPVIEDDAANASLDESDVDTAGDVSYRRDPDGTFERGTYLMRFKCTVAGEKVEFPEDGYILVDFN